MHKATINTAVGINVIIFIILFFKTNPLIKIIIDKIKNGKCDYSFVEVMSCPGGCIGGGGQPKSNEDINTVRVKRSQGLYLGDSKNTRRVCYQNKEIIKVYQDFYVKPGSHIAHEMLHTKFHDQSDILKG